MKIYVTDRSCETKKKEGERSVVVRWGEKWKGDSQFAVLRTLTDNVQIILVYRENLMV